MALQCWPQRVLNINLYDNMHKQNNIIMEYTHTPVQVESAEEEKIESIPTDPLVFSREEFDTGKHIYSLLHCSH